ncbi:Dyp-type peroxidase [Actinoplanes sp. NPDC049548]|uniref:Dyp-type peroxidase n=1 Tax=Actinoplanes sp. NPDC049548 TaxID=3155152 RepID=UPI003426A3DF
MTPGGGLRRRQVLTVAAAGLVAGCSDPPPSAARATAGDPLATAPPAHAVVASYRLPGGDVHAVADLLRQITGRADAAGAGAEVLIGLGATLFDRAGLPAQRPRQLTAMPSFPGDVLDPGRTHGDLLLQAGAGTAEAAERLLATVAGPLTPQWRVAGFRDGAGTSPAGHPTATNPFHFTEGHGNPDAALIPAVVRVGGTEPAWAAGGTYQVVRVIRLATQMWDRDPVEEQERVFGRRRDGTWLDGTAAAQDPPFARDPDGAVTPLDAHVRLARGTGPRPEMLRRGYSFRAEGEEGMLFLAYQRDLERGFAGVQRRLAGERLARYVLTVGGGYFFVPPAGWTGALFPR